MPSNAVAAPLAQEPREAEPKLTYLPPPPPTPPSKRRRQWAPRLWEGTDCFTWMRMLRANKFSVRPAHWYIAAFVSVNSILNTTLRWWLNGLHGERVRDTELREPPVFVIGH